MVSTGTNANHAGQILRRIKDRYPDVHSFCVDFRFPGQGQKDTPVAGIRGLVEIIMLLAGEGDLDEARLIIYSRPFGVPNGTPRVAQK